MSSRNSNDFRVIISGGGIAGLTLANALQLGGIDFLLLERRNTIAPQVGASIGILPNGSRILDQIGCCDEILELVEPLQYMANHREDGSYIEINDGPQLGMRRMGYDMMFLDRQDVLRVLARHIDPNKILLEKNVESIEHTQDKVIVKCTDGTEYAGDILAGADGVNSQTRKEMWRLAKEQDPATIPAADAEAMSSEYKCMFGISSRTKNMPLGWVDVTYTKDTSTFCITGKDHKVYWFIFQKFPKVYKGNEIPKYTREDADKFGKEISHYNIQPKGEIIFGDIWANRMSYTLVALEEAEYKKWTWGRIACLGDSIHKMTPNAGHGGNAAIESAAALANSIKAMLDKAHGRHPTYEEVTSCLGGYQKVREKRTSEIMKVANKLTRIQALKTFGDYLFAYWIGPALGDALLEMHCDMMIGAVRIDYLPPPPKSLSGTMPFNPEQGVDKAESKLSRAFIALPFLVLSAIAMQCMDVNPIADQLTAVMKSGEISWATGTAPIIHNFYGVKFLDELWRIVVVVFSQWNIGFDIAGSWQMFTFLTDFGLLYSIYLFEASRRANVLTLAQLPALFGLAAQFRGIGVVAPIYYFFHYTFTPIDKFASSDTRLTNMVYTKTILPAMALAYYIPQFLAAPQTDLSATPEARMRWNWIWQMFPVWVSVIQYVLKWTGISIDTVKEDRIANPRRDLPLMRTTIGALGLLSATVWIYTLRNAPVSSWSELFVPTWPLPTELVANLRNFVQFDHLFCFGSTFLWLGLLIHDLKAAGMAKTSWVTIILTAVAVTAVAGPAAAVGLGWLYREHLLATKRHKGAILETTVMNGTAKPFANGSAKEINGVMKQ